jgi:hypothetical protein
MHLNATKFTEGNTLDFIVLLFTHGLDDTLDFFCTLSVFSVD